jgi:hypothetical protein
LIKGKEIEKKKKNKREKTIGESNVCLGPCRAVCIAAILFSLTHEKGNPKQIKGKKA